MVWKMILDAIRFILAKYELVARHGDLFYYVVDVFQKSNLVGDHSATAQDATGILSFFDPLN